MFLIEFTHLWLTSLSEYTDKLLIVLICVAILSIIMLWYWFDHTEYTQTLQMNTRHSYVTYFRAYANIATAVCILAVDFQSFPRRFCKAETFGTGLMDIGVGAFVVANGLVSNEARSNKENLR